MPSIPGNVSVPGVYTDVQTLTRGVSVPGGTRLAALVGEGSRAEVIIGSALGDGLDGLNSTFTSTAGSDGRHFQLSVTPIVENRATLFRNGIPLVGLESVINSQPFDNVYDYRIDPATGRIEMQSAYLGDQGGLLYKVASTNTGVGTIENLEIVDANAPAETWTIKCISVQRDGYGSPITETARFLAYGTVSGALLDGYGNPVVWKSDDVVASNSVLSFSVKQDSAPGASVLREGDSFTVLVKSGVLSANDSLTATYIAVTDLNDPTFFDRMEDVTAKHGAPSLSNTLSTGAFLAFQNGPPGVYCVQSKPALPRRTSYLLDNVTETSSDDTEDYIFPLPVGVQPNVDSNVNIFVRNPTTGIESQVLANKHPFFTITDSSTTPTLSDFIFSSTTYDFFYTVMERAQVIKSSGNGVIDAGIVIPGKATLSSATLTFGASDVGKEVKIFDATNETNTGTFTVSSVTGGSLDITFSNFAAATAVTATVVNAAGTVLATVAGDGVVTPGSPDGTSATFSSATTDFSAISSLTTRFLKVTSAANTNNVGLFLISALGGNNNEIVVKKFFVDESSVTFQVIDPLKTGSFVVVNQSVVPAGSELRVSLVDERDALFYDAGGLEAFASLEAFELDIVCPLPSQTKSAIFQNALAHCRKMSNIKNKRERVLFMGAVKGLTPENITGERFAAVEDIGLLEGIQGDEVAEVLAGNTEDLTNYSVSAAFGNTFRCVYFYPDEVIAQLGANRVSLDGFYLAAAAAGFVSGQANIAIPLTNKVISGVTILKNKLYSPTVVEKLLAAGVTLLQPVQGGGLVIRGRTTTQSGFVEEEEISIVFIRDRIAKSLRTGFAGFIGLPEDPTILASLTARAVGLLSAFITQGLITAFDSLSIQRDSVDPTQWNISVRVQPNYPVSYIFLKVNVGLL